MDTAPTWWPDGSQIAFSTNRDGNYEIYTVSSADGSGLTRITTEPGKDGESSIDWSSDGDYLAFGYDDSGNVDVYTVHTVTLVRTRLTTAPGADGAFGVAWSADDSMIVFGSDRDGGGPPANFDNSS